MTVYHILKDGSRPKDITGHIVKFEDAEPLYRFIRSVNTGEIKLNSNARETEATA